MVSGRARERGGQPSWLAAGAGSQGAGRGGGGEPVRTEKARSGSRTLPFSVIFVHAPIGIVLGTVFVIG